MHKIQNLIAQALAEVTAANDLQKLEALRVHYLGKKGILSEYLKNMSALPSEERRELGKLANEAKDSLLNAINQRHSELLEAQQAQKLLAETLDVTLPGRRSFKGSIHPISQTITRVCNLFTEIGFKCVNGPEIENEYYNFEALNTPELHPARAMHDTFYFADGQLLRSHTSPVQIREMENNNPPFRIISVGKVYRRDYDLTHTPMFHQIEGLMVDEGTTFADLKGILEDFVCNYFEEKLAIRLRPSYFPFTEPSAEVDVACFECQQGGCRLCSNTGWLEILGCGMVHPNVFKAVNIDPEKYTGFAFGCGIERLAMLRYRIQDIRLNYLNDVKFLAQF